MNEEEFGLLLGILGMLLVLAVAIAATTYGIIHVLHRQSGRRWTDLPRPAEAGPSWSVHLPDGIHVVALDDGRPNPSRLRFDERSVELTWPLRWRGSPEPVFMLSGRRARLVQSADRRRTFFTPVILLSLVDGRLWPMAFRHDLDVDGALVERLDASAPHD